MNGHSAIEKENLGEISNHSSKKRKLDNGDSENVPTGKV